jgi:imidazolonepropionase-like amidohydrolase
MMKNKKHYIKIGWLIDGSGAPVQKKRILTVEDGVITGINPFNDSDSPDPDLTTDLSRCTILPPLVDCHVHLAMSGTTDPQTRQRQLTAEYDDLKPRIAEQLHYHFSHGVLAVRDGGDRHGHVLRYKNEREGDGKDPVTIKTAGRPWYQQGRYGAFIGHSPAQGKTLDSAFAQEDDGADHVKLINSGLNSLTEFGKESAAQFSLEEIQKLVALASQRGQKVMVHANGRVPVRMALEAGCHSVEHGFFMGRENLRRMAEERTVWVPTAVTMKALLDNRDSGDGQGSKAVIAQNLDHQLEQITLAREFGVSVALGTDAGCRGIHHGESVVEEMKLLMTAGYSLVEAIGCASHNGAKLLGLDDIGIIAKGRPAHFIVARTTPAMLPRKLSCLEKIYLNGEPCDKAFFNKI